MSKPPVKESRFIDGPAGRLESIIETPREGDLAGAAVVCHPHPLHGGTMHNKVAHTLARSFLSCQLAVTRFNFRGVEASEGEFDEGNGEVEDVLAAIQWTSEHFGVDKVWLGGFSFGAAMAIRAASTLELDGLVSIAPAVARFATGLDAQPAPPWLVLIGDQDELVDVDEMVSWVDSLEPGPELLVMQGAEHFFHGRLVEAREHIVEFVSRHQD